MRQGWIAVALLAAHGAAGSSPSGAGTSCKVGPHDDCTIDLTVDIVQGKCVVTMPGNVFVDVDGSVPPQSRIVEWVVTTPGFEFKPNLPSNVFGVNLLPAAHEGVPGTWIAPPGQHGPQFQWILKRGARRHELMPPTFTYEVHVVSNQHPAIECDSVDPVIGNGKN